MHNFIGFGCWLFAVVASLCALASDGYRLQLPSYLESEVKITKLQSGREELVQYIAATVQFKDWGNYRIYTMNSSTLQDSEESEEKFIFCGEEEVVVIGGKELVLRRNVEDCKASIPETRESLQTLVASIRQEPWIVFFSTKADPSKNLTTIAGLGGIVGEYDLLDRTHTKLNLVRGNIVKSDRERVEAKVALSEATYDVSLALENNNWRIARLVTKYANSRTKMDRTTHVLGESGLRFETTWTQTEDDGSSSKMRSVATLNPIRYDQPQTISMTSSINDDSSVLLTDSPQIKAVWKTDRVLRVYDRGYADDIGSAVFSLGSSSKIPIRLVLVTLGLVVVGSVLLVGFNSRTNIR